MQAIDREPGGSPSNRYEKLYTMLLDAIPSSILMIDLVTGGEGTGR